ncbi:class I SAM-dependent methyltransferase [Vibrio sp. TRT 17S01]|uniref:class I SAM-dependent methyltransferase n=1 Tax=Vibrio sp. TRT 17S01 TaxID=3418505 RepID=UPI003CF3EBE4
MASSDALILNKRTSQLDKLTRALFFKLINHLDAGSLIIDETFESDESQRIHRFGFSSEGTPTASIEIHNPALYSRVLKGGSIAAAEAYMDGWWDSPDLIQVIELFALNMKMLDKLESKTSWMTQFTDKLQHWLNRNTLRNSTKNIHAHYDIGNALYKLFLDSSMLYSAAVFNQPTDSLEVAQTNKMERLCQQLQLSKHDHVIEIGTGWGAMAIYMAKQYGCQVTTTTISEEQYNYTKQRIIEEKLEDKITLLKKDYRLLEGQFDKLVSIEMIEAVGKEFLSTFIEKCNSLLKANGLMAIQAITIADQRYDYYSRNVDFIQKYIFPGGFLPSVSVLTDAATSKSELVVRDLFDIGLDYQKTLEEWLCRFDKSLAEVRALGFDSRFIRMWRFYFCYCAGGFKARTISTVHMTFEKVG